MSILEIKNGSFSYTSDTPIFENVSFSITPGEIFTLLGPNGAGKSSLLSCLVGLNHLNSGQILVDGKPAETLTQRDISRRIGFVPQNLTSVYAYSVMEYVVMGRAPYISAMAKPKPEDYALAAKALESMGITHLAYRKYSELSGGERQQVAIARILVQDPALILLDEPTSALDFGNQIKVIRMVRELSQRGYSVIMTTHVPDHAVMLGGSVGILDRQGRMTVGKTDEIITEELLSEIYRTSVKISYVDAVDRMVCLAEF